MDKKPAVAFFDLDHTLLDGSNGNIYAVQLIKDGYFGKGTLLYVAWYSVLYKLNRLPQKEVYRKVLDLMGQYTVLEMIGMMDRGFAEHILPRLYAGGVEVVKDHQRQGHLTVIATAAGEYIAERVRAQLGADDVIATTTPIRGDRMTSDIEVPFTFMEGKLEMARDYCEEKGADLADCWFYSDSASDLPLLEAVGHPVVVNPQLKLRMATRGRGWPVLKFREYASFDGAARPEKLLSEQMDGFVRQYEASLEKGSDPIKKAGL